MSYGNIPKRFTSMGILERRVAGLRDAAPLGKVWIYSAATGELLRIVEPAEHKRQLERLKKRYGEQG